MSPEIERNWHHTADLGLFWAISRKRGDVVPLVDAGRYRWISSSFNEFTRLPTAVFAPSVRVTCFVHNRVFWWQDSPLLFRTKMISRSINQGNIRGAHVYDYCAPWEFPWLINSRFLRWKSSLELGAHPNAPSSVCKCPYATNSNGKKDYAPEPVSFWELYRPRLLISI